MDTFSTEGDTLENEGNLYLDGIAFFVFIDLETAERFPQDAIYHRGTKNVPSMAKKKYFSLWKSASRC